MDNRYSKKTRGKLSRREKILLSIFILLLSFFLLSKYWIAPRIIRINKLNNLEDSYSSIIEENRTILENEKSISEELESLEIQREKILTRYFNNLEQSQLIYVINRLMTNNDLYVSDYIFSGLETENIDGTELKYITVDIPFKGNYKGISKVLDDIQNYPKKIIVQSFFVENSNELDKNKIGEDFLTGKITLKICGLEDSVSETTIASYRKEELANNVNTPFKRAEISSSNKTLEDEIVDELADDIEKDKEAEKTLIDFKLSNSYFEPSHKYINGDISKSNQSRHGSSSLLFKYDIIAMEETNRAYIDISKHRAVITSPPENLGIWIHSKEYMNCSFGIKCKSKTGLEMDLIADNSSQFTGWKYLMISAPNDDEHYPLNLEAVYLEAQEGRDVRGSILIDKLSMKNEDK